MEQLLVVYLKGKLLALKADIWTGWKGFQGQICGLFITVEVKTFHDNETWRDGPGAKGMAGLHAKMFTKQWAGKKIMWK